MSSLFSLASATVGGGHRSRAGYRIDRSVRLRNSAGGYFSRSLGSASNRRTWTWSGWVKRTLEGNTLLLGVSEGSPSFLQTSLFFSGDNLRFYSDLTISANVTTTAVFRDPSAWYHVVCAFDTTQATASDRIKFYVNGVQQTALSTTSFPTQNSDGQINNTTYTHQIGRSNNTTSAAAYLTEINFINGQALTPASFGEINPITGVWQPKEYTGTYGTNGYYLNFSDNSAATAAAIGKDYSGNGNNWTPNNISVTAGVTYDSMLDVPTQWGDGGNGRGNYCTLNPLDSGRTLSQGNLFYAGGGATIVKGTIGVSSGKWYWEFTPDDTECIVGIVTITTPPTVSYVGSTSGGYGWYRAGSKYNNGASTAYGTSWTTGDIIGVAFDADAGTLTYYKNNTSQGVAFSGLTGNTYCPANGNNSADDNGFLNFGQRPFAYTPPTGFKALNTLNLPTPTILKGNQYFDIALYNNATVVSGLGFAPDLVWHKSRNQTYQHYLYDKVRGVGPKGLNSSSTAAEGTNDTLGIVSFDSSGVTYSSDAGLSETNAVGWFWKEGATQGFDIVTASLSGTSPVTVNHSLGVAPKLIIGKVRDVASTNWYVYSASIAASDYLVLNSTAAKATSSNIWDTAPTSTVLTVGNPQNGWAGGNSGSKLYVFYLFAEVAGFSKFGSYTGNGSADGPFVFCGFRPRFVMWKNASASQAWLIEDTSRSTFNQVALELYPSSSGAEAAGSSRSPTQQFDFLSNGFKVRGAQEQTNGNGNTIIFAAFAEHPFKNALAR